MTAATSDRDTQRREAVTFDYPALGGVEFYVGAQVAIDSATGFACPCTGIATQTVVGVAQERVNTVGVANGAVTVKVRRGCFRFSNDAAPNSYSVSDIGSIAHALDDATVSKAAAALAKSGIVRDIDPTGDVWIEI